MHCDRCNIDFPEGLRYCKWCGQALNRPRTTSELHLCTTCGDAIQPGWAFCKSCGAKLGGTPQEPPSKVCPRCGTAGSTGALTCVNCGEDLSGARARSSTAGTSVIAHCGECGEVLDPGTVYCKACGAPTHGTSSPFGPSSLLCSSCGSRNPVGSADCRICGAHLAQGGGVGAAEERRKLDGEDTLPDLAERLPKSEQPAATPSADEVSGARTLVFDSEPSGDLNAGLPTQAKGNAPTDLGEKRAAETSVLTGDKTESTQQPTLTSQLEKGRTTAPVESAESTTLTSETPTAVAGGTAQASGELSSERTVGLGSTGDEIGRVGAVLESASSSTGIIGAEAANPVSQEDLLAGTRTAGHTADFSNAIPSSIQQGYGSARVETVAPGTVSSPARKAKSNTALISIIVALIVVGLAGYLAYWFVSGGARPAPRQIEVVKPTEPVVAPPPEAPKPPQPPDGMLLVAAGDYTIGRDEGDPLESPAHVVTLTAFFIDRTEITNAQYKIFVDATGHDSPEGWADGAYPAGQDEWPVTGVTWQDAADYAEWAGKRLPTEAEWEAAARGPDRRLYPWGNEWKAGLANIGARSIMPVAQFEESASPVGALDMIGNVWEWTSDEFAPYPGSLAPMPKNMDPAATYRVIRGGAFDGNKNHSASYRGFVDGAKGYDKTGFRCVKAVGGGQ